MAKKFVESDVEIILIDDQSNERFIEINSQLKDAKYIQLIENVGRSRIRNLFLDYALGENLIFLDCDVHLTSDSFLKNYENAFEMGHQVVVGGRIYPEKCPNENCLLSWTYGVKTESKSVIERNMHPNQSFMTNNFGLNKTLFREIKFNENLRTYGHEDTLFGIELNRERIKITHIDNPVVNIGIEDNKNYLKKTEEAIKNIFLIKPLLSQKELNEYFPLVRAAIFLKKNKISNLFLVFFDRTKQRLVHILQKRGSYQNLFKIYKLGIYLSYDRNKD